MRDYSIRGRGKSRLFRCLALSSVLVLTACGKDQALPAPGNATVQAITVEAQPLALAQQLPGRIEPTRVAEVRARVPGIVLKRHFVEGSDVEAGDVLFEIDPAPFKAALSRAQGELARAEAQHYEASALVKRYEPLVKVNAVSAQDFDSAQAALRMADAARVSARANVETAQLELDYATVTAPISGRIGRALVTEGALVGQGEATALAIIQQIDTVYVDFTQSVAEVMHMRAAMQSEEFDAENEQIGTVTVSVDGLEHASEGRLLFSDISVDRGTGQLTLRGEVDNEALTLLPGMYVRVKVESGVAPDAILIPQRAIRRSLDGQAQVLTVDEDSVVQARSIRTGQMHGSTWHVVEGLEPDDRVVVGGSPSVGQAVDVQEGVETASQA